MASGSRIGITNGGVDRWMDDWMDGWMDGWKEERKKWEKVENG